MKMCTAEDFWNKTKKILKERKLTWVSVAKEINIDDQKIRNWIYLKNYPSLEDLLKISECLSLDLKLLLTNEELTEENKMLAEIQTEIKKIPTDKRIILLEFIKTFNKLL